MRAERGLSMAHDAMVSLQSCVFPASVVCDGAFAASPRS
jgi:hypothetical protein